MSAVQLRSRLVAVPAVWLLRVRMNAVSDALLAVAKNFHFLNFSAGGNKLGCNFFKRRIGAKWNSALWRTADTDGAVFQFVFKQRLYFCGYYFVCYVNVGKRWRARQHSGVQMIGTGNGPGFNDGISGANVLPVIQMDAFTVAGYRPIAARQQLLSITGDAIQHLPSRLALRQFLEFVVIDHGFALEKTGSIRAAGVVVISR